MRKFYWALALAALASSNVAFAAADASASISNLSFKLTDLDLEDGVLPSFSVLSGSSNVSLSASSPEYDASASKVAKKGAFSPVSGSATLDDGTAGASASVLTNGLSVSGFAHAPSTSFSGSANATNGYYNGQLKLSANSLLKISGKISTTASISNLQPGYYWYSGDNANASATVSLSYNYYADGSSTSYSSSSSSSSSANGYYYYYDESPEDVSVSDSKNFNLFFVNTTNVDQYAWFSASGSVGGYATTAPIPEAETLALGLAGLGVVLSLQARRRKV